MLVKLHSSLQDMRALTGRVNGERSNVYGFRGRFSMLWES